MDPLRRRFGRILDGCKPYMVASPLGAAANPRPAPLGIDVAAEHHFNPHEVRSGEFLGLLQRLDELTFAPLGMPMPRWVFYDCAEVPGGIFGFCQRASDLPIWARRTLGLEEDAQTLVPVSMFVAIPLLEPGHWHTYTLCSLNEVAPGAAPAGLRLLTQAVGLQVFGVEQAYGATQWRSPKLAVHVRFGPLELVTAWTPAHSDPFTLTYRCAIDEQTIHRALSAIPIAEPEGEQVRWVDCDDKAALKTLQRDLESGERYQVIGPPREDGAFTHVPLRRMTP